MANINKIKLSGTTYTIQDENAPKTVELTQAQYDALAVKDPNTFYIITDAEAVDLANYYTKSETDDLLDTKLDVSAYTPTDLSNYYTKSETSGATQISTALASKADTATTYTKTEVDNAITAGTSTKQDTLVSGTNIKTINNESILGSGNIDIQGGSSINVVQTTGTSTADVMSQDAVTTAINKRLSSVDFAATNWAGTGTTSLRKTVNGSSFTNYAFVASINQKPILSSDYQYVNKFSLVETSAITTSVTSASTDSEIPSAKAVNDKLGGLSLVKLTQAEYDALTTKDSNTLYVIVN